jgi:hypothetical protein
VAAEGSPFQTAYLTDYLDMVENTESPRVFHIWSALWAISSALGRRCWLPFGHINVLTNQYVLLIGTPASRKSTALSMARRLLRESTKVRFAPDDTGGQRQGLAKAIRGIEGDDDRKFEAAVREATKQTGFMQLTDLENFDLGVTDVEATEDTPHLLDAHHIVAAATEFSRFIGQNNLQLLDFLVERYDGEDYDYLTNQSNLTLKNTLMNLIAATTPVSLNHALPPAAGGQGILSRMILVYGAKKWKEIPTPIAPDADIVRRVKGVLHDVHRYANGPFCESASARVTREGLYAYRLPIADSRFAFYAERRYMHLIKLAMCLAATRVTPGRDTLSVEDDDYHEAHRILRATEVGMPDALGEFGLNPLAVVKQEILEELRRQQAPLTMEQIVSMFHRDATSRDIAEVITDLHRAGQIVQAQVKEGRTLISAKFRRQDTEDEMMRLLSERAADAA